MVGARERVKRRARAERLRECAADLTSRGPSRFSRSTMSKRVAALDFGAARVGLAVTDELGAMAHARPVLDGRSKRPLLAALAALARDEEIDRFVVGLPLEMTGEEGPAARRALAFAHELAAATGRPVEMLDERLTTVEASRRLAAGGTKRRGQKERRGYEDRIDGEAARVLLDTWLDHRAKTAPATR